MLQLQSPAKVNLFLRILGKRPDGYHEFASLMQTLDFCDQVTISLEEKDRLTCTDSKIPTDETNLVSKAVALLRRKIGFKAGVNVHLTKNIPVSAGLGGGSSNAATVLWGINKLLGEVVDPEDLMAWAGEIGSDVPFFFSQGTAYCTGRGEKIRFLPPLAPQRIWIVKPPQGLSTKEVYSSLSFDSLQKRDANWHLKSFYSGNSAYFNDLETSAFMLDPKLKFLQQNLLEQGFSVVLMSGSGSSFFCIGSNRPLLDAKMFVREAHFTERAFEEWYPGNISEAK